MQKYKLTPYGSGHIGALIEGLDLTVLDEETFKQLRKQWLYYKVLFIRGQSHLTPEDFGRVGYWWGEPEQWASAFDTSSAPEVHIISHDERKPGLENMWHTDTSWLKTPPFMAANCLQTVPERGSDTLFADTNAMYENLPDVIKKKIHGMRAVHLAKLDYHAKTRTMVEEKEKQGERSAEHPIVIVHPETGKYHLNVNPAFTDHVVGLSEDESKFLLRTLYDTINFPEFQCRHWWQAGDVGLWDNRAVVHYACSSYWPNPRSMYRMIVYDRTRHNTEPFEMAPKPLLEEDTRESTRIYQGGIKRFRNRTQFKGVST